MLVAVAATAALLRRTPAPSRRPAWLVARGRHRRRRRRPGWSRRRRVPMTAMPQLVSLFNAAGGGAAALIAVHDVLRLAADAAHAGADRAAGGAGRRHRRGDVLRLADRLRQAARRRDRPAVGVPRRAGRQRRVWRPSLLGCGRPAWPPGARACPLLAVLGARRAGVRRDSWCCPSAAPTCRWSSRCSTRSPARPWRWPASCIGNSGAHHRRRAGRRVRHDPHQADGRRDEPVDRSASSSAASAPPTATAPAAARRVRRCGNSPSTTRPSSSPTPARSSSCPATGWPPRRRSTTSQELADAARGPRHRGQLRHPPGRRAGCPGT